MPKGPQIIKAFIGDGLCQEEYLLRELAYLKSSYALACDHQGKVAKHVRRTCSESNDQGFVISGDGGTILSYGLTPNTNSRWTTQA